MRDCCAIQEGENCESTKSQTLTWDMESLTVCGEVAALRGGLCDEDSGVREGGGEEEEGCEEE